MFVTIHSHFVNKTQTVEVPDKHFSFGPGTSLHDTNAKIFRLFNRVSHEDAVYLQELGYTLPSLSVGDTVFWRGRLYAVEPTAFREVPLP